jgi:hypothetical protein
MTEEVWVICRNPAAMLRFLRTNWAASDRKMRLFAVACCGRIAGLLDDPRSCAALQVAERYADGAATEEQRAAAARAARQASARFLRSRIRPAAGDGARQEACAAATATTIKKALLAARRTREYALVAAHRADRKERSGHQSGLLRDIFGPLPFRPVSMAPSLLIWNDVWNDGAVVKLAQGIYEGRAFDRLPVLADALEEAGCDNQDLLSHCRSQHDHVLGCWVVDLLLGKG